VPPSLRRSTADSTTPGPRTTPDDPADATDGVGVTGAPNTHPGVLASGHRGSDPGHMTSVYAYGTAHAVVMVGSFGVGGLQPRQIGPAHATIGRVSGQSRKALCGAYVSLDEQQPWPPEGYDDQQLCDSCAELASL
jgi:hypothetical protein